MQIPLRREKASRVVIALAVLTSGLLLSSAPIAFAQEPTGLTLAVDDPAGPLDALLGGSLNFTVTVGCADLLGTFAGGPSTDPVAYVVVAGAGPAWLMVGATEVEFHTDDCVGAPSASLTEAGNLSVTPGPMALGLVDADVTVSAALEGSEDARGTATATVQLAYLAGYEFNTTGGPRIHVQDGLALFQVSVRITANAPTMVMFNVVESTMMGDLSGFPNATVFDSPFAVNASESVYTYNLTYTATGDDWTMDSFTFTTLSHAALDPGQATPEERVAWTFVAGGPDGNGTGTPGDDGEDSPAPPLALGLFVVAVLVLWVGRRRRRDA